jgi:hypothetical protein
MESTTPKQVQSCCWWLRHVPRFLHRVATIALILLTIVHLHTRTRSFFLAGAILAMASTGLILEKAPFPTTNRRLPSSSSMEDDTTSSRYLALSLFRATLYAFVGDAAAAQLLLTPTSTTDGESFELANDECVQLGLAGVMWTLGGLLWIIEPLVHYLDRRRRLNAISNGETGRLEGGYDIVPQEEEEEEVETIIIWEEEDFELPIHAEKF